jgi:FKBP-type peptidyl-prolyl cis-trans isomerase FklB
MKKQWLILAAAAVLAGGSHAEDKTVSTNTSPFKTDQEKLSYALGMNFGNNLKREDLGLDLEVLSRGIKDMMTDKPLISLPEARETLMAFQRKRVGEREEKMAQLGAKNKTEGDAFLAANKSKPGVITLTNGLQYKVITDGKGESPTLRDAVTVNYRGTLIDGAEFDSSYKRGEPATFPVTGVIRGWTEALQLMKPGAKWQLFIPPDLAYREFGQPPKIGPNATLIFEIELLSFKPAVPPPAAAQPITSDIIRVPSAEEIKKGAKPEIIKADEVEKQIGKPKPK